MGVRQGASGTGEISWVVVPSHSRDTQLQVITLQPSVPSGSKGHSSAARV